MFRKWIRATAGGARWLVQAELNRTLEQRVADSKRVVDATSSLLRWIFSFTGWLMLIAALRFLGEKSGIWILQALATVLMLLIGAYVYYLATHMNLLMVAAGNKLKHPAMRVATYLFALLLGIGAWWAGVLLTGRMIEAIVEIQRQST